MVFGTVSAVRDLAGSSEAEAGSFPRPGISDECFAAYCELNPREPRCG